MSKRAAILLGTLLAAAGAGWFAVAKFGNVEPVYQGKRLTYWLQNPNTDEAGEALVAMGSNAFPILLRRLQARDSLWKKKLMELAEQQNVISVEFSTAEDHWFEAVAGFAMLGDKAAGAVPSLVGLHRNSAAPALRERVAEALGAIGPSANAAVPILIQDLADTNSEVRASAAEALWHIGSEPALTVPALTKALDDSDSHVRWAVIGGLGVLQTNARTAVPKLLKLALDTNEMVRSEVMDALRFTRGEPPVVVPVLTNALYDSNEMVRAGAALALSAFGADSAPAIPRLLELAQSTNENVKDLSITALGETVSEPDRVVPALIAALSDSHEWVRANAADGLGNFGTNARSALTALAELYHREKMRAPRTLRSDEPDMMRIIPGP